MPGSATARTGGTAGSELGAAAAARGPGQSGTPGSETGGGRVSLARSRSRGPQGRGPAMCAMSRGRCSWGGRRDRDGCWFPTRFRSARPAPPAPCVVSAVVNPVAMSFGVSPPTTQCSKVCRRVGSCQPRSRSPRLAELLGEAPQSLASARGSRSDCRLPHAQPSPLARQGAELWLSWVRSGPGCPG